ncbi:hypothetical protein QP166_10650 [Sphingomonas sp. LR60]|uniref:hypothetical protein n=1 Tax=Sphingomonas sp. LR60 TaxID=3050233 RepID=UPI002FE33B02
MNRLWMQHEPDMDYLHPAPLLDPTLLGRDGIMSNRSRHCERSEAIQGVLVRLWIASPCSQ